MFRKLILAALVFLLSACQAGIFPPAATPTVTPTPAPTFTSTPTPRPDAFDPEGRQPQSDYFGNKYSVDPKTGMPAFWFNPENNQWQKFEAPPNAAGEAWMELQKMIIDYTGPGLSEEMGVELPPEFYEAVKPYEIPYVYLSSGFLAEWVKENFPLEEFLEKVPARAISLDDFEKDFLNPPGGRLEENAGFDKNGFRLVAGKDSDEFRAKMYDPNIPDPDEAFRQPIPELIFFTKINNKPFIILPQRLIYEDRDGKTKQEILFYYFDPELYFDRYFTTETYIDDHPFDLDHEGKPNNWLFTQLLYKKNNDGGPAICLPLIEFRPDKETVGYYDESKGEIKPKKQIYYDNWFWLIYAKFYQEVDQKMPFYKDRQKILEKLVAGKLEDMSSLGRYPQACVTASFGPGLGEYYRP
jgi:hypothetical protein